MAREVELSSLDLRYEGLRLKAAALEERLLGSIAQRGIEEPLEGVEIKERSVLLNGFKRYRCARKLRLATVPYASLGSDEGVGILSLLRTSNNRALRDGATIVLQFPRADRVIPIGKRRVSAEVNLAHLGVRDGLAFFINFAR
jgi:hypothetical protein